MVIVSLRGAISTLAFQSTRPRPQTLPSRSSLNPRFRRHTFPRMTSSAANAPTTTTIEHVVLFKVKQDADPSLMLTSLNSLVTLDQVVHLSAGPIHRTAASPFPFTHMLHSRYASKDDLQAYAVHPAHVSAVKDHVLPACDDVMAVDWVADDADLPSPPPGSALRFTFLKLKEEAAKEEVLGVVKGIKDVFGNGKISQLTCGENFSPARAKGYSLASVAVFPGLDEMDAVTSDKAAVESHKQLVRDRLDSVIVVDYVVPTASQPASL